jgi:hypothetical protein
MVFDIGSDTRNNDIRAHLASFNCKYDEYDEK